MLDFAMFISLCVDVMVISFVYFVSFAGACGAGLSDVYMSNNVGDKTPASGTPV